MTTLTKESTMRPPKLTDLEIKVRIVPTRVRWPEARAGSPWTEAHNCVHAFENVVRDVDLACLEAAQNKDLSGDAIRRRRAEIYDQALARLVDFRPLEMAEQALSGRIRALENLNDRSARQVEMLKQLKQALADLREGVGAARRMLLETCKVRAGAPV
jgi:hypothetical protein